MCADWFWQNCPFCCVHIHPIANVVTTCLLSGLLFSTLTQLYCKVHNIFFCLWKNFVQKTLPPSVVSLTGRQLRPQHAPPGSHHVDQDCQVTGLCLRLRRGTPRTVWGPPPDAGQPTSEHRPGALAASLGKKQRCLFLPDVYSSY